MPAPSTVSRRSFLRTSAAAAAGVAAFGVPAVQVLGANETLNVGAIGTGGRCQLLMRKLTEIPNVRLVAVCDVYQVRLDEGRKIADPKAFATGHYQELLDRKDVDAVVIGAPDHWHVPLTIAACAAGKDVYVEKPLTHNLNEGQAVIEAVRKHERIVQVGTQQRSMPHLQKAAEIVRSGGIGKVHKAHLTWNRNQERGKGTPNIDPKLVDWKTFLGNAPEQPFDPYKVVGNWRWFWDFGGGLLTDLMVHWIDVVHWYFDLDHPQQATTMGDHFTSKGVWQTPDTVQTLLSYPEHELQVYFEGTFCNARNGAMVELMGTDGTLYLDRGRYEIYPEKDRRKPEEMVLGSGPRGKDFYDKPDGELLHLTNWVECVRSRKPPNAPVEAGVSAASAAHLGNEALRSGQVVHWKA